MFTPARVVVIDDNPAHLDAIRLAVEGLGSSCVCVTYSEESDPPPEPFARARVIFMDLNLRSRDASSDFKKHFAEVQRLLTKLIPVDAGPFLLVIWTDRPEQVTALEGYLTSNLFAKLPHTRPVRMLGMSKSQFIALDSGATKDPEALQNHVWEQLESVPALAALLRWETEIIAASDRVVHDVLALASAEPQSGSPDLSVALRRLAVEAVGGPNVGRDPQGAIHSALLPLLQDHIQYESVMDTDSSSVWGAAVAQSGDLPSLTRIQAGKLNARLHLGGAPAGMTSSMWGAVCEVEDSLDWSTEFGMESASKYRKHMFGKVKTPKGVVPFDLEASAIYQIRVGASCDYAQRTDGPVPFVLCVFVPVFTHAPAKPGQQAKSSPLGPVELSAGSTIWMSPILHFGSAGLGHLLVDPRFNRVRGGAAAEMFAPVNRLREQLLMELLSVIAQHGARPGIVRFSGRDSP